MASKSLADIIAALQGKTLSLADLTKKPELPAKSFVGTRFTILNAQGETKVGGELVRVTIRREDSTEVTTTLPVNEISGSLVVYFMAENAPALENVTFVPQGHTFYLAAKPLPESTEISPTV